ncbi:hypothetical protein GCM10023208_06290 [Erythrobacter westpacificensis]|uniref:Uncharacterized protein n=1 Tax=Erythrobacter westpacificensis TaxID=1055231 RepID=A0ABP9K242_9SPHN
MVALFKIAHQRTRMIREFGDPGAGRGHDEGIVLRFRRGGKYENGAEKGWQAKVHDYRSTVSFTHCAGSSTGGASSPTKRGLVLVM